jgi:hypothetical protein
MKPLLIMTADGQCAATIRGFFEREKFHLTLGCGPIELAGVKFNPEKDISVHPGHDPGVWSNPQAILLAQGKIYEKVMIVLDHAWDGAPEPEQLIADIEHLVVNEAKLERHRFEVILIRPELEAWIWQRNPHVVDAFGFNGNENQLWTLFEHQSLHLDKDREKHFFVPVNALGGQPPAWPLADHKPENPKGLVEALSHHCQSGPPSEIFTEISSTISVKKCVDPAFHLLREKLREWFPKPKAGWEK